MNYRSYILGAATLLFLASCEDEVKVAPLEANMKSDRTEVAAGDKVCFMDQSSGNPARWDWEFEGGEPATSQLFSPEIVYNKPGTYSVTSSTLTIPTKLLSPTAQSDSPIRGTGHSPLPTARPSSRPSRIPC